MGIGKTKYEVDFPINTFSSLQLSLADNWRKRLQGHQETRRKNVLFWQENVPNSLQLVCAQKKGGSLIRFPILARSENERDVIYQKGQEAGCGLMPTYPAAVNEIPQLSSEFVGQHYPNAKCLAECLLTLPVHEYVSECDQIIMQKLLTVYADKKYNSNRLALD